MKNQLALLKYYQKYGHNGNGIFGNLLREKLQQMKNIIEEIKCLTFNQDCDAFRQRLMGLEGSFGAIYWNLVKCLLNQRIDFPGRIREGAKDLVNSTLNYGYGILYGRALNALIRAGLNPLIGFLHNFQTGKPVLVYDIIEEFRPMVVDRAVFSMFNRGMKLSQADDSTLTPETRKKIAKSVISRLASEVYFHGRRITLEEVIQEQAHSIGKHLKGKIRYRPFLSRW